MAHLYWPTEKINVYLETSNGLVLTGETMVENLSIESPSTFSPATPAIWEMTLAGTGSPSWAKGSELSPGIAARFLGAEWECQYCGRANHANHQQCQSCGWYRGIIADVVQEMGVWRAKS